MIMYYRYDGYDSENEFDYEDDEDDALLDPLDTELIELDIPPKEN
jgi:hypothetical protein